MDNVAMPVSDHVWIREFDSSPDLAVINYGQLTSEDYGYTAIAFGAKSSFTRVGIPATLVGKSLLYAKRETI